MFLRPHNTVSSNAVINSSELFSIKVWTGMELESNWYGTGMELVWNWYVAWVKPVGYSRLV